MELQRGTVVIKVILVRQGERDRERGFSMSNVNIMMLHDFVVILIGYMHRSF